MVVNIAEQPVCRDEIAFLQVFSQNLCLHYGKADTTVRDKTIIVQQIVWIVTCIQHGAGRKDLIPGGIDSAPDDGSPCPVEVLQCCIMFLEKFPKCKIICFRVKFIRFTVQLIVNLPADHGGM